MSERGTVWKLRAYAKPPPASADQRIHISYWPTATMLEAAEKIERLEKLLNFTVVTIP